MKKEIEEDKDVPVKQKKGSSLFKGSGSVGVAPEERSKKEGKKETRKPYKAMKSKIANLECDKTKGADQEDDDVNKGDQVMAQ